VLGASNAVVGAATPSPGLQRGQGAGPSVNLDADHGVLPACERDDRAVLRARVIAPAGDVIALDPALVALTV
jgi:hypothetical protein